MHNTVARLCQILTGLPLFIPVSRATMLRTNPINLENKNSRISI